MFKIADYTINEISTNPAHYMRGDNLKLIRAQEMWQYATGKGVTVAIIDTGTDRNHPALKDKILTGMSFVPGDSPDLWDDGNGHGTHVAGIVSLIAPDARLLILKALDNNGSGSLESIVRAIKYATWYRTPEGRRIDIINMSLGAPTGSVELHEAIKKAVDQNILVCCAAGNEGDGRSNTAELSYPAMYQEVVSVGAVDFNCNVAMFSNSNNEVDLAAPGTRIWSTLPGARYGDQSGTSMACPHAVGMAALYIEKYGKRFNKRPTEPELYLALKIMSLDIGSVGIDADTGAGLVSAWL